MNQPEEDAEQQFLAAAERLSAAADIDRIEAAVILAICLDIGQDSRSLSKSLGIAHALVLRAIETLSGRFIQIIKRDRRTQRTFVSLTAHGSALAASTLPSTGIHQ